MAKVRSNIAVSVDGFIAGPNQSEENGLGEGGEQLHEWTFKLAAWQQSHGREGGETGPSNDVVREAHENIGAVIMGRNMFGPVRGDWGDESWKGWWGDNPPYHVPVYVLTHHAREPLEMEGGTTFYFVTDGIESALKQARDAAGDQDVHVPGGATAIRQYLAAGLLDELELNVVPILLRDGTRLFEGLGAAEIALEPVRVVEAPDVTHVKYRVSR